MCCVAGEAFLLLERTLKPGESSFESLSKRPQLFRFLCAGWGFKLPRLYSNMFSLLSEFMKRREDTPQEPDHSQRRNSQQDGRGDSKKADRFENFVPDMIR